jgi:hypothetical protein
MPCVCRLPAPPSPPAPAARKLPSGPPWGAKSWPVRPCNCPDAGMYPPLSTLPAEGYNPCPSIRVDAAIALPGGAASPPPTAEMHHMAPHAATSGLRRLLISSRFHLVSCSNLQPATIAAHPSCSPTSFCPPHPRCTKPVVNTRSQTCIPSNVLKGRRRDNALCGLPLAHRGVRGLYASRALPCAPLPRPQVGMLATHVSWPSSPTHLSSRADATSYGH